MDFFFAKTLVIFLINIIAICLASWVYFDNRKNKINILFLLFTLPIILWINFNFIGDFVQDSNTALLFKRLNLASVCIFFIFVYFFSIYFPKISPKRNFLFERFTVFVWILMFICIIFTDLVIRRVELKSWGYDNIIGSGGYIFYLLVVIFTILVVLNLTKKYFFLGTKDKVKIKYFLIGSCVFFAPLNLIFNVVFPVLRNTHEYYQFGDYSAIFLLAFTAYAITKHELMGIKTLITQVLIAIISLILLVDVVLLSDNITMQLLKIGILLAFLYFSRGMIESVRNEKKARKELEETYHKINVYIKRLKKTNLNLKEKNEDLGALLKISDVATGTLNSRKIAQNIVDGVPVNLKHLGYMAGILILYDKSKGTVYTYTITETSIIKKAKKLLDRPFGEHSDQIDDVDNLVMETIKTKQMQIGNKLEDFIAPTVNKNICKLIQKLIRAKSFISIPIFSGGRIKGTILFIGTKPKKKIVQRDKDILFGFSSHIGATIENAQLYEQTEKQIKALSILNENLKMANIRLKELMEMKNEFLHITSHQLRTPLTTIRGMISMWYNGEFDNLPEKEKRKMLKRIYVSSERLNNITNDMLDSLELEGGLMKFQFKQVSLKEIIRETIDIMRPNFDEKNLYLKFNDNVSVPKVEVEPNYIRQVFINTIDNACKYTREGGVDVDIKKTGKYLEVIIKDTGIGVSKSDQKKIFLKFTRGRKASAENASGSGLGLFIARKIVGAHNGKIEFSSKGSGKGSVVKIFLPVKQG